MDYSNKIIPILVGTDINVYGMARSFHEEYGVKSHCIGVSELIMTKDSKICDVTIVKELKDNNEIFVNSLIDLAKKVNTDDSVKPILICAGDEYTELAIQNEDELSKYFVIPYPKQEILSKVYYKDNFYALCEKYNLPYPKTVVVDETDYIDQVENLQLKFPVAMKPVDAAQQIALDFEGQRKAYKFENKDDITDMIKRTYAAGYDGKFLLQDFIPGGDTHMHTINFYADADHNVRMMTMGQQLLQDPSEFLVGNYIATMIEYNQEIEDKLTKFVKEIKYSGYGNFDLKYDDRDNEFKLIELNPRQGRSSFYTTASGYNLVKYSVEDLILHQPFTETVYADTDFLWVGVNAEDAVAHVDDLEIQTKMKELIAQNKYGDTLRYDKDKSITRNHRVKKYYASYKNRF